MCTKLTGVEQKFELVSPKNAPSFVKPVQCRNIWSSFDTASLRVSEFPNEQINNTGNGREYTIGLLRARCFDAVVSWDLVLGFIVGKNHELERIDPCSQGSTNVHVLLQCLGALKPSNVNREE